MIRSKITNQPRLSLFSNTALNYVAGSISAQKIFRRFLGSHSFNRERLLNSSNQIGNQSLKNDFKPSVIKTNVDWEDNLNFAISHFSELPHSDFGINQHILINDELEKTLRQVLWHFRAPIRYAFVYGSGIFPQSDQTSGPSSYSSLHPHAPVSIAKAQGGVPKMIDFIFGVSYTQHWHSLNLVQNRGHYSALGSLGSAVLTMAQDKLGAGVYFNPYVTINGITIKYGVVNLDTLCADLTDWKTLYLAGRLQKPVKILRDNPRVRLANQVNLISALRTALLLLPPEFTEYELYSTISSISYMGDPRMTLPTENPRKVANIVGYNLPNFRRLYLPLIEDLPNVCINDPKVTEQGWISNHNTNLRLVQDMDPVKRGNMVRRLPKAFRSKLYFHYQKKYQISHDDFVEMIKSSNDEDSTMSKRCDGGGFERRIANEAPEELRTEIRGIIKKTVRWPSTSQSLKGILTAGLAKTWRYVREKMAKNRKGKHVVPDTKKW